MIAAYLRVSGQGQIEGDGFPRQREAIQSLLSRQGAQTPVPLEFRDEGVSGTRPLSERPGLLEALESLRIAPEGEPRVLIVEKADRLARDLVEGEMILRECRRLGIQVIEADSGQDLTSGDGSPTSTLIRQVLGAVAEFEKSALVSKLRAARSRKRATTGRCEGQPPPDPELVAQVRRWRSEGWSLAEIARHLDDLGIKPRRGSKWSRSTVSRMC